MPDTGPCVSGPPGPGQMLGVGGDVWADERGTHLHADIAPGAVVGPGWAVEAAFLAPVQAEGPVVHPYHMHHHGALFIGAWHGKRTGQYQEALPSVCCWWWERLPFSCWL